MSILAPIAAHASALNEIYKDLHAHPELGLQETRTAGIVANLLREWGVDEVHEGIAVTGVVGIIKGKGRGNRSIGLRADMDALPVQENTGLPFASTNAGKMHACGHDGHTTILLGAAKYLAETRNFDGNVVLIFQPAEEGAGGAKKMVEEGLFERFPCEEIYGMHNSPNGQPNTMTICKGPAMAGAATFDITVKGVGAHAAQPHTSRDALLVAASLAGEMQTIHSRNLAPLEPMVLSVTQIHAGTAYNVIPEVATLCGTIRFFSDAVYEMAVKRMREICAGYALAHGVEIEVSATKHVNVLTNVAELSEAYADAARDILGDAAVDTEFTKTTGSEDFADMLAVVPGAYCRVGHAGDKPLHSPYFWLDTSVLPVGASIMARVAEKRLPLKPE